MATFTVFTPTYNRGHTLERVYDSLRAQTHRDFEWLVVDDGSTDDTREIVQRWQREADFVIRYHWQANAGKHVAFNTGVRLAHGELFLPLDSDDACVPESLERLLFWWQDIPEEEREGFSAVTVLCRDQHGQLVGDPFPTSPLDSTGTEVQIRYRVRGEKWGFQRTSVLREHPYPEAPGVRHVSPSVVWRAIDKSYRTRFVNEALRTYWRLEEGKRSMSDLTPAAARASVRVNRERLDDLREWFLVNPSLFLRTAANLSRFGLLSAVPLPRLVRSVRAPWARLLVILMLPLGAALALRDRGSLVPDDA